MNQEALEALFQLFPEGMFDEPADLNEIIEKEGLEGVYPLLPEGMFESEEEFVETFGGQKKKRYWCTATWPNYGCGGSTVYPNGRRRSWFFGISFSISSKQV